MESDNTDAHGNINLGLGGGFHQTINVYLSKDGQFKEGTIYQGMITVMDTMDHGTTLPFSVTVLHDRGKKTGLNK